MMNNLFTHAAMVMSGAALSVLACTHSVAAQTYAPTYEAMYEPDWTASATGLFEAPANISYSNTQLMQPAAVTYSQGTGGYYAPDGHWHVPGYTHTFSTIQGTRVFQCAPGDSRWRPDEVGQAQYYVDGTPANSRGILGGDSGTTTLTNTVRPACRIFPKSTNTQTVILEWVTQGATTAFLDNGIGHVSLGTGGRMVTPTQSTVYTMTVVNERGASAQCAANIIVQGSAPVGSQTLSISRAGVQQLPGGPTLTNTQPTATAPSTIPATVTYDTNGNVVTSVTNEANKVGTNVLGTITNTLSGGQSVWERVRVVSMIALALFFTLTIIMFVIRRIFGGGGESAGH